MQIFTVEQANQAMQIHTENAKTVSGSNSKINQLRDKFHNDVDVIQRGRVTVPKGAAVGGVGKLRAPTVIVLTRTLADVNIMPEHGFYYPNNAKNKMRYEPCLDFARAKLPETTCPICKAAQQNLHNAKFPYMRMALTVVMERIDESGTTVAWDKKLLVVKNDNFKTFNNLLVTGERANNGVLRGMAFVLERGTGEKTLASGTPATNPDNSFAYSFVGEDFLAQIQNIYQPTEVRSEDGKFVYKPTNWLTTPIDINNNLDILNYASEEDLRKEFDPSYVHNLTSLIPPVTSPTVAASTMAPSLVVNPPSIGMPSVVSAPNVIAPTVSVNTGVPALPQIPSVAAPAVSIPPVPAAPLPALAQQRNLTPVVPVVGNGNVDDVEVPWDQE